MRAILIATAAAVVLAGCAADTPDDASTRADTVTQGARDSAVARSGLPGAAGVGKAQDAAAEAAARAARLDSLQR